MVISHLCGGLGNQLFQYAMGRRLAEFRKTELKLDTRFYTSNEYPQGAVRRHLSIQAFNITAAVATEEEIRRVSSINGHRSVIGRAVRKVPVAFGLVSSRRYAKEASFDFERHCLSLPNNVYLRGYWQSEKYFQDIEPILRSELTLRQPTDEANQTMLDQITQTTSVSLHVRRGDYVTHSQTNQFHGLCSLEYYHKAVEQIASLVDNPYFFVFSDDPNWTKQELKLAHPTTYVAHNGEEKDYEDLRLMSHCKHHVIANSSFSWWGAWLATHPTKRVIAPRRWFKDAPVDASDIVPENWLRL